jgi:hypothetical protein
VLDDAAWPVQPAKHGARTRHLAPARISASHSFSHIASELGIERRCTRRSSSDAASPALALNTVALLETTLSTEAQARSNALLEDIQSHVKVIAEGHGALTERLDDTEARLARIEGRFAQLEIRIVRSTRPRRSATRSVQSRDRRRRKAR